MPVRQRDPCSLARSKGKWRVLPSYLTCLHGNLELQEGQRSSPCVTDTHVRSTVPDHTEEPGPKPNSVYFSPPPHPHAALHQNGTYAPLPWTWLSPRPRRKSLGSGRDERVKLSLSPIPLLKKPASLQALWLYWKVLDNLGEIMVLFLVMVLYQALS